MSYNDNKMIKSEIYYYLILNNVKYFEPISQRCRPNGAQLSTGR